MGLGGDKNLVLDTWDSFIQMDLEEVLRKSW